MQGEARLPNTREEGFQAGQTFTMAAQRRQALIDAAAEHDAEKFSRLLADHRSRTDAFNLDEVLVELSSAQLNSLWDSLLSWLTITLDTLIPEHSQDIQPEKVELVTGILDTALSTVHGLGCDTGDSVPAGLLQTAVVVNALLLSLDELPALDAVCERISRLSELWWSRQLPQAAVLAPGALTYLLQLTVATDHRTTRQLVQRVLALRPCLAGGADLSGAGPERLRQLLCAAVQCPALLAWDDGVRLVAELLAIAPLRMALHAAVKAVLPGVSKQQALKYGQAYYRAWRAAGPVDREDLEERCIQDLMYHAVHAERRPGCRLARLLYQLLHSLHGHRRHRDTAAMLVRLYQPILWRALTAPNETVQLNGTFLFLDLFPLEEPGEARAARDLELSRQCRLLADLLQESSHLVRAAAAKGVCRALTQYWDIIPGDCLKQMMKVLLQDLAYDAASVEVRLQVVSGITVVLENPYTHAYMKSALPFLADAFHDVHLSVRVAVCDLLLKVKSIKNIRYFDVVPVKHLLARLATDEPPVCRRIVQLMVNSFFPVGESDETLLSRCICLIQENREASRRFYQHSLKVLSTEDVARLMVAVRQALTLHARRLQARHAAGTAAAAAGRPRSRTSSQDKENSTAGCSRPGKRRLHNIEDRSVLSDASQESTSSDESAAEQAPAAAAGSPLDKEEVVLGLVDVVAVLWTSRLTELAQQPELLGRLQQLWSRVLPWLFSVHRDGPAGSSLLYLASLLPHTAMAPLASHCLSALRQLPEDAAPQCCAALLDPLVNWGRCDDLLELCTECLQAAFDGERSFVASQKNQRRSAVGVRFRDPRRARPRPRLALRWLLHLFTPSLRRHVLANKYAEPLRELHAWMAACLPAAAEERLSSERSDSERDDLVAELLRALLVVSLALGAGGEPDSRAVTALQEVLVWGQGLATAPARWANAPLLKRVSELLTGAAVNTSLTGCLSPPLAAAALQWMTSQLGGADAAPARCLTALFHAADLLEAVTCRPAGERPAWTAVFAEEVPRVIGGAVGGLVRLGRADQPAAPAQLAELGSVLRSLLASWRRLGADGAPQQRDLAAVLLAAVTQQIEDDKLQGSTAAPSPDLSPLSTALLAPLWRDAAGTDLLTTRLSDSLAETARDDDHQQALPLVVTAAYVLHALTAANGACVARCGPAVAAALAAADRIQVEQLTGDDAVPQHLEAARQLLRQLAGDCCV